MSTPIIELAGLTKRFVQKVDIAGRIANLLGATIRETVVQAVTEVDLAVGEGEVLGLVGDSACGKSTLGRMVAGILEPSAGEIRFRGTAVARLGKQQHKDYALG